MEEEDVFISCLWLITLHAHLINFIAQTQNIMYYWIMSLEDIRKSIHAVKKTKFGYSIPEIRKLAKKGAKLNHIKFLDKIDNDDFWIKIYFAYLIGYIDDDIDVLLKYFEKFMPYVDDWAVNDALCQNFRQARIHQREVLAMLMKYKNSKKEFEVRVVAAVILSHFLNDEYIDKAINILDKLYTDSYYSRMGVAWAVATIVGKYPEKGLAYLKSEDCHLDEWTYNKALQKIRESFRVSENIKMLTKSMKK